MLTPIHNLSINFRYSKICLIRITTMVINCWRNKKVYSFDFVSLVFRSRIPVSEAPSVQPPVWFRETDDY